MRVEMTHALLEGHDLNIYRGERLVLTKISLNFNKGERVAVIGRNGVGKTTLLMALAGITKYKGNLFYQSKPCHHGEHRQQIGYVPQRSQVRWDLPLQVIDVVASGMAGNPHLQGRAHRKAREEQQYRALLEVGALPLARRMINSLSGGQAQRVLIARSLVSNPDILLLDEPLSGLDIQALDQVIQLLHKKSQEGTLVVAAMHELDIVRSYFQRTIYIESQTQVIDGSSEIVLQNHFNTAKVKTIS